MNRFRGFNIANRSQTNRINLSPTITKCQSLADINSIINYNFSGMDAKLDNLISNQL